ncbi:pantoate--beta-alanine ligase [Dehalogenimonas etheniformans]|uniref:Pantothenate synthetase n=1 Tax=Dehalogenimonas etheniformans TaxID=1536648 RepID=A0A2P5P980_9CHLR|nr:pantoate--beta-alanine ligase [Dehalogenimonas etheniformans]PPD58847.1 pantoate--beta-alanine ligase [Dehalogenimonas etheniformans]QNT77141.1 pantoate--beta-alanine ligase [Dehalogenimonas etheniformans]
MKILRSIPELKAYREKLVDSVGFVPTMGFLHDGHLSLVRQSKADCDHSIVSIFVNPPQFGPNEDFNSYPRDIDHDLAMLDAAGADAAFLPSVDEMYPEGADTFVVPGKIAERLEGAVRPGHFRGVATVVLKLFNLIQAQKAYFGQKDAQQVAVLKKMVADLNVTVELVVMPIIREKDGLAMSSRNTYLSPEERQAATVLYRSLKFGESLISAGEQHADVVKQKMIDFISADKLARIDYVSIADQASLEEQTIIGKPALISLAVRIGRTRLIDNSVV